MSEKLSGTTAIVTGAAGGIGAATAKRFAREGAALVVTDKDGPGAHRVAGEIAAEGGRAIACRADVCDLVQLEAMLAAAKRALAASTSSSTTPDRARRRTSWRRRWRHGRR